MTFQIIKTNEIPLQSIEWLKGTLARTPMNIETAESIISACNNEVYLVKKDNEVRGSVFMVFIKPRDKLFLNIVAIGGIGIGQWRLQFREYVKNLLEINNAELCIMTGSKAWGRIFNLKTVGYIYTV